MARAQKRISIVLVDDDRPPREATVDLIRAEPGFRVQTISAKLEELARAVRKTRPDLVLLNLARKGRGRLRFAAALHHAAPALPVIIMGMAPRREDVVSLVRAGVGGFIMAEAPFDTCVRTIVLVARGSQVLPPALTTTLFVQLRRRHRVLPPPSVLRSFMLTPNSIH